MKRIVLFLIVPLLAAQAASVDTDAMVALYKKGEYRQVCTKGMLQYYKGYDEPHFAAMVGMACSKVDEINPLGALQRNLVKTPALRSSATYFSTLVLAKRLLYQHFIDGIGIEAYKLPKFDHVLSIVYDHVSRSDYRQLEGGMIRIEEGGRTLFVSASDDDPIRLLVDEYEGAELVRRHWYQ
jgi:hypothetical protein